MKVSGEGPTAGSSSWGSCGPFASSASSARWASSSALLRQSPSVSCPRCKPWWASALRARTRWYAWYQHSYFYHTQHSPHLTYFESYLMTCSASRRYPRYSQTHSYPHLQLIGLVFIFIYALFGIQFYSERSEVLMACVHTRKLGYSRRFLYREDISHIKTSKLC